MGRMAALQLPMRLLLLAAPVWSVAATGERQTRGRLGLYDPVVLASAGRRQQAPRSVSGNGAGSLQKVDGDGPVDPKEAREDVDFHKEQYQLRFSAGHWGDRQELLLCNAYPQSAMLHVTIEKAPLTGKMGLPYKSCEVFQAPLRPGDMLECKVGDIHGAFHVLDLPARGGSLLLVIHPTDGESQKLSFSSHVFAPGVRTKDGIKPMPQIAVVDAYRGSKGTSVRIQDIQTQRKSRSEDLRYGSVAGVNAGQYEVVLVSGPVPWEQAQHMDKVPEQTEIVSRITAVPGENYVVIRCGSDGEGTTYYPEELVVFPESSEKALPRSATVRAPLLPALGLLSVASAACWL